MSLIDRIPMLAPFRVRGFRFQWPADLITNCAFEMETIILGWWIYAETGSVQLLTAYGALHFLGTVVAPMIGVVGDRIGQRRLLTGMRVLYTIFAATLLTLASTGQLTPLTMFMVASAMAFVRTSDIGVRTALVTDMMPAGLITAAIGVSRTTSDVARITGALTGSGLFALFGISFAYVVIVSFYATGLLLTIVAARSPSKGAPSTGPKKVRPSPWRELREGLSYIWTTPHLLGAMWLAVLVNLTAFPLSNGLMPYIAREIFKVDKTGLGYLVASFASGALVGSLTVGVMAGRIRLGRMMLIASLVWHAVLLVFAQMTTALGGIVLMMFAGFFQSLSMVTLAGMLMRTSATEYRGRVMGVRMLATYSLPVGLLVLGWMIEPLGFAFTASLSALTGIVLTLAIGLYWRVALWRADGVANLR